jgi:hypothetical protein
MERTCLCVEDLNQLLSSEHCKLIREEKGTHRANFLIWSEVDQQHYVVVLDTNNHTLVTLLYTDYYQNCGCVIPSDLLSNNIEVSLPTDISDEILDKKDNQKTNDIKLRDIDSGEWILTSKYSYNNLNNYESLPKELRKKYPNGLLARKGNICKEIIPPPVLISDINADPPQWAETEIKYHNKPTHYTKLPTSLKRSYPDGVKIKTGIYVITLENKYRLNIHLLEQDSGCISITTEIRDEIMNEIQKTTHLSSLPKTLLTEIKQATNTQPNSINTIVMEVTKPPLRISFKKKRNWNRTE